MPFLDCDNVRCKYVSNVLPRSHMALWAEYFAKKPTKEKGNNTLLQTDKNLLISHDTVLAFTRRKDQHCFEKSYIVSLQKVKVVFFIQQHPAKVGWYMKQTINARPKLVREPYTWLVFCWDKLFLWTWVRSPSESHKFMSNMWQLGFAKNTQNSKFMGFSRAHIEAWVKNAHLPSLFFIGRVQ